RELERLVLAAVGLQRVADRAEQVDTADPAVAQLRGASHRAQAVASDVDRQRRLDRLGVEPDRLELGELTREAGLVLLEEDPQAADGLVGAPAAARPVVARRGVLG